MPLSRFTQTLPLDFAAEISGSDTAPVGADLAVPVFFGVLEELPAAAGLELGGGTAAADFAGGPLEPAGALAGAELAAGAAISLVAFALLLLFLVEAAAEPSAAAPVPAGASVDAGAPVPASLADFFLLVFLELPVST